MNDKQQIEEMAKDIEFAINNECKLNNGKSCEDCQFDNMGDWKCQNTMIATYLYGENYRKLPENAVVLTREDMKKYAKDCIAGQETGLDIINALIARAERYKEQAKQTSKETAREILKSFEYCNDKTFYEQWLKFAKQYGVEVEE